MNTNQSQESLLKTTHLIEGIVIAAYYSGNIMYQYFTQIPKFDVETKERYYNLKQIYQKMAKAATLSSLEIPDFWELQEDRPQFKLNIQEIIHNLNTKITELETYQTTHNLFITELHNKFISFLDSVQKRNWFVDKIYSSGMNLSGLESMFLAEMASWLSSSCTNLSMNSSQGLKIFYARKEYCKEIAAKIPQANKNDEFRPSFKSFIDDMVNSMEVYYKYSLSQYNARELNEYIDDVDAQILYLIRDNIKLLMSCISASEDYQKNNIDLFMSNDIQNYPKIIAMRNSGLGSWLYNGLLEMGITNSTYLSMFELDAQKIEKILIYNHPNDYLECLNNNLKKSNAPEWGHRSFVYLQENSELKANHYNWTIRELIRSIGWLTLIKKNLKNLKAISSARGWLWVYSSELGRVLFNQTLENIKWIMNEKIEANLEVFAKGYIQDGLVFHKKNNSDFQENKDYSQLNFMKDLIGLSANTGMLGQEGYLNKIRICIKNIENCSNDIEDMKQKLKHEKISLITDLIKILKLRRSDYLDTQEYEVLKKALKECQEDQIQSDVENQPELHDNKPIILNYYIFKFLPEQLKHFQKAKELLASKDIESNTVLYQTNRELFFKKYSHHFGLSGIYVNFIAHYSNDVLKFYKYLYKTNPVVAFFIAESWKIFSELKSSRDKLPQLREIWIRINNVFTYMVGVESPIELIELEIIYELIKEQIRNFYKTNKELNSILMGFEPVWKVELLENQIEVHLNDYALSIANSSVYKQMSEYLLKIKGLESAIKERDLIIKERDLTIKEQKSTIVNLKSEIVSLTNENTQLKNTVKEQSEFIDVTTKNIQEGVNGNQNISSHQEILGEKTQEFEPSNTSTNSDNSNSSNINNLRSKSNSFFNIQNVEQVEKQVLSSPNTFERMVTNIKTFKLKL